MEREEERKMFSGALPPTPLEGGPEERNEWKRRGGGVGGGGER